MCAMEETNQLGLFNQSYSLFRLSLKKSDSQLWQMTRADRENYAPSYLHVRSPTK